MNENELQELLADCPVLYHMAERGSWGSIQRHGLLSTSALLDLYEVRGSERAVIETERRPDSMLLKHPVFGQAVVRDQKPMDNRGLERCLQDELTPVEWYQMLNARVFFWLTRERLLRLLRAGAYADKEHDVLELDAAPLVRAYREAITLSPINSGSTKPFPSPRGRSTFLSIDDYPYATWRAKRKRGERVVELSVLGGVPDVGRYVSRVTAMRGNETCDLVWER